jgi:release factor glutamine methyltransferase
VPTIGDALAQARTALKQELTLDEREAGLEAHVLLGHALEKPRAYLIAHRDASLGSDQLVGFQALLQRRLAGEPVAYLLGEREFFGLTLQVTPEVLIPRPETELLAELGLALIPDAAASEILDLGTGSGAVAIVLAKHRPAARVTAVDQSEQALAVAESNAQRLGVTNIRFLHGDWFAPLDAGSRFDLIVGNPPYIAESDPHLAQGDLRFEPRSALASGADGLDAIRAIAAAAGAYLKPGGWLLLEHGFEHGAACRKLLADNGFQDIRSDCDLAGLERVTAARQPAGDKLSGNFT